ncbi:DUF2087 domain-containing protein [Humidisolicoccus flavus]|uniref:DUF2087 domain-containing protein n=1 Tax=Humidisolicoccus flavus TaxID=3111414 RepID=UPI0032532F47
MDSSVAWRPVYAALANQEARRVYAAIVLGTLESGGLQIPVKRQQRALQTLENAGLISREEDGSYAAANEVWTSALAQASPPKRVGIERFINEGRITSLPAGESDRLELLEWVSTQVLRSGETLSERALGERIQALHPDTALIRRYLIDHGMLTRSADGSTYSLIPRAQ